MGRRKAQYFSQGQINKRQHSLSALIVFRFTVTATPVTMAVKSHLRGGRPVLIALATNDALSGSAKNLGALMNIKGFYFCPLRQDDYIDKPASMVADFSRLPQAAAAAIQGRQLQPVML